jgi:hypothetical protein
LNETFSVRVPDLGRGLRYELPVRVESGWLASQASPTGKITVKGRDKQLEAPLATTTQALTAKVRTVVMAALDADALPEGSVSIHAEATFSPGRAADELAWTFAVPAVPCRGRDRVPIQLAWPEGFPTPAVEAHALQSTGDVALEVRSTAEGHDVLLPGCGLAFTHVMVRATFAAGALSALPAVEDPGTVLEHRVQVHADGSITVSSATTRLDTLRYPTRLSVAGRGELQSSRRLHPVKQLFQPVPWDISRSGDRLPSIEHRAFGNVGEVPNDASRTRLSFTPPMLEQAGTVTDGAMLNVVRIRLDEPGWQAETGPNVSPRCWGPTEEACAVEWKRMPRPPARVEHPAPGEWILRYVQPVHEEPWTVNLELSGRDPTRRFPLYPWALLSHVLGASGMDEAVGASDALVTWLGLAVGLVLLVGACWLLWRWRPRRGIHERTLQQQDAAFQWKAFEPRVGRATALLMEAWDEGKLERARHVLSSGVYQRFRIQCRLMHEVDGTRNRVQDFELLSGRPEHVGVDGPYQVVHVRLRAKLRDVTLPAGTDEASARLQLGKAPHQVFEEIHTWVRKLGAKSRAAGDPVDARGCPGCGAPSEFSHASARCGHCGVVFNAGEADWVLAEITQVSEWAPARESAPLSLPPGLSRGVLEDKASALFWRALEAGALGEERLRPFTTVDSGHSLEKVLGPTSGRHSAAVVGGVTLRGVDVRDTGALRATLEVRWSSHATHRRSEVTLELSADDRDGVPVNYADASDCRGCGAPAPELYAPTCANCGGALPVRVRDWRLVQIA